MKILLVQPYWPYPYSKNEDTYNRIWPPLSLLNCAAFLEKQGHVVTVLDAHAKRLTPDVIKRFVVGYDKIFITSSSLDKWQCPNVDISPFLATVAEIRTITADIYLIGYHGTRAPKQLLDATHARAVVRGEPEYSVLDVCQSDRLRDVPGISFYDGNEYVSTPDRVAVDMKTFLLPAYHLVGAINYSYEILGDHFMLFEMSRGCSNQCTFCNKVMFGDGLRVKTREQIAQELAAAIETYGVRTGYFFDLDFFSSRALALDVCDYLIGKKYPFSWCCQTRPDQLSKDVVRKMKAAGCRLIHLGVETNSEDILRKTKKNLAREKSQTAIKECRDAGIQTLAFYLVGFEGERDEERRLLLRFAQELDTDYISMHRVVDYKECDGFKKMGLHEKKINAFIQRSYLKYYLRWSRIRALSWSCFIRGLRLFYGRIKSLS